MSSSCRRELQSRTPSLAASPRDFVYAKPNMCVFAQRSSWVGDARRALLAAGVITGGVIGTFDTAKGLRFCFAPSLDIR